MHVLYGLIVICNILTGFHNDETLIILTPLYSWIDLINKHDLYKYFFCITKYYNYQCLC